MGGLILGFGGAEGLVEMRREVPTLPEEEEEEEEEEEKEILRVTD